MDDKRRTPSELKTKQSTSAHKKLTPNINARNDQRKLTPNTTARNLNLTMNTTMNTTSRQGPFFKSNLSTLVSTDWQLECDIAYYEYLEAEMKKVVATEQITDKKRVLKQQIIIQREILHNMEKSSKEVKENIDRLQKETTVLENVQPIQETLTEIQGFCDSKDLGNLLVSLLSQLNMESDKIALRNVQPLKTQQDYDKFVEILEKCNKVMERMLTCGRDFAGVNSLANAVRTYNKLKVKTLEAQKFVSGLQTRAAREFLQKTSDILAARDGGEGIP